VKEEERIVDEIFLLLLKFVEEGGVVGVSFLPANKIDSPVDHHDEHNGPKSKEQKLDKYGPSQLDCFLDL